MATPIREMKRDGIYHVCNRGNNKMYIFLDREDKEKFLIRLFLLQKKHKFTIIVFCIMDNHFHILINDIGLNLPNYIAALEDYYAKYFNKKYKHQGHVFQGPFRSYLCRDYLDILKNFRYIIRNPVAAGISNSIYNYEWTVIDDSSRFYKFIDFTVVEECLLNTGNPSLQKYIINRVDDLWAHQIEKETRSDDEATEFFCRYTKLAEFKHTDCITELQLEEQIGIIKYLVDMGLTIRQIKMLTNLTRYRISKILLL